MQIIISINDIWRRYTEQSLALKNVGVDVNRVIHIAYGYAVVSANAEAVYPTHTTGRNIFTEVSSLLIDRLPHNDRLPFTRQSAYGGNNDTLVYHVVDLIGEISQMLIDAVVHQLGSFPPHLRLLRFVGPDLVLTTNNEEDREFLRYCEPEG